MVQNNFLSAAVAAAVVSDVPEFIVFQRFWHLSCWEVFWSH